MKLILLLLALACCVYGSPAPRPTEYPHPYPNLNTKHWWNREVMLTKDFHVRWNSFDKEWLVLEMSTTTTGYIAIGISPNGGMNHADIVMGWVDANGTAYLKVSCHQPTGHRIL